MKIIKLNEKNFGSAIEEAREVLKKNGLVIYPTDTVYGLGANATSEEAVRKVFEAKGRDCNKPVSVAFGSIDRAKKYVYWNENAEKLAKFLPGPLTLVLKLKKRMPERLTCGLDSVGVRVIDNGFVFKLLENLEFPITTTSANLSGGGNPINVEQAIEQIGKKVDLVIDAGPCKHKKPSTAIDLTDNPKILRIGTITEEEINNTPAGVAKPGQMRRN